MNAIIKSIRLDFARLTSNGFASFIISAAIPILYELLFRIMNPDTSSIGLISTAIVSMVAAVTIMFTINVFRSEDQNGHRKINGIIPVSRASQVIGRYTLVALIDIAGALEVEMCLLISMFQSSVSSADAVLRDIAIMLVLSVLCEAILLPVMYRFSSTKVLQYITFGFLTVFLAVLAIVVALSKLKMLNGIVSLVTGISWSVSLVAALVGVLVVVAVTISFTLSRRIYLRREL